VLALTSYHTRLPTGRWLSGGALVAADVPMTQSSIRLRPATRADAPALAELVNLAGEGLPLYLWTSMAAPGQDASEVGRSRALREEGGFSYRNSVIAELDGETAGCLIGYALAKERVQTDLTSVPPMFVPLQELEDLAPDTWYVNVVATYAKFRGRGVGSRLLELAEQAAREADRSGVSLIVADANVGARRLYARTGYREIARRPIVKERWQTAAQAWVLMLKALEG
jgi:ribosomal protein S18 acetylase RimI-like enzyme